MESPRRSKGGRPPAFDREQVLDVAMRLFWRHGYEGVGLADLTAAMGIAAPSLYAAFGSKAGLYRAALDRYQREAGPTKLAAFDDATDLDGAVRAFLGGAVAAVVAPRGERGCMVSSGMVACATAHAALAAETAARREALRLALAQKLERWLGEREAAAMARHLCTLMQGLSIQARDGATRVQLDEVVEDVVAGIAARFPPSASRGSN